METNASGASGSGYGGPRLEVAPPMGSRGMFYVSSSHSGVSNTGALLAVELQRAPINMMVQICELPIFGSPRRQLNQLGECCCSIVVSFFFVLLDKTNKT